ncbi:MAG: hypothetical protein WEB58_08245 [Planctomycetaceae bacterium]
MSEIELMTPSALTNASPVRANARCARMSSRACKSATFVAEAPPKPPLQEAEENQATQNHPPLPDTQISQQSGTKYGENGEVGTANIAAKSCFDMYFARTKREQKHHSRAQKRHSRAQKQDFARISAQWQTPLWEKFASGEVSVVRGQWSVVREGALAMASAIADLLRATIPPIGVDASHRCGIDVGEWNPCLGTAFGNRRLGMEDSRPDVWELVFKNASGNRVPVRSPTPASRLE